MIHKITSIEDPLLNKLRLYLVSEYMKIEDASKRAKAAFDAGYKIVSHCGEIDEKGFTLIDLPEEPMTGRFSLIRD